MISIGLTGNIGSGKSIVARIFSALAVPVYHADLESKRLLEEDEVKALIRSELGDRFFTQAGTIDRKTLASLVFSDANSLAKLNHILHSRVMADFDQWSSRHKDTPYIILEAAILFETGYNKKMYRTIVVSCPPEIAIRRVVLRDQVTREDILMRMKFQWTDEEKVRSADFVIRNDGDTMLIPQVIETDRQLRILAMAKKI